MDFVHHSLCLVLLNLPIHSSFSRVSSLYLLCLFHLAPSSFLGFQVLCLYVTDQLGLFLVCLSKYAQILSVSLLSFIYAHSLRPFPPSVLCFSSQPFHFLFSFFFCFFVALRDSATTTTSCSFSLLFPSFPFLPFPFARAFCRTLFLIALPSITCFTFVDSSLSFPHVKENCVVLFSMVTEGKR